jgi:hypothetical protein
MADHPSTTTDSEDVATDSDDGGGTESDDQEIPSTVVDEAERLTHLAREAVVEPERAAYLEDRAQLLADHEFVARVRDEDDTLVLHPEEWVEDGTVYPSRIDDTDRAVEVSLSGPGDPDDWEVVEQHNADVVDAVRDEYGEVHAANVRAFADFMGNHYARRVETATAPEVREFLTDYFPRNAWPSAEQRAVVKESIEHVFDVADADAPTF